MKGRLKILAIFVCLALFVNVEVSFLVLLPGITLAKVNCDDEKNHPLAMQYEVEQPCLPLQFFCVSGQCCTRHAGCRT